MTKGIAATQACLFFLFFSPLATAASLVNGDFEDWTTSPPSPWQFSPSSSIAASQETAIVHGGVSSAAITWTTQATRALQQGPLPAASGETYTVQGWFHDNEPAGRARIWVRFLDDTGALLDSGGSGYTADAPDWQMLEAVLPAPAMAQSMEVGLRFFDVSSSWVSNATVYVDDVSIAAAPVPPSLLLMGSGLLGLITLYRRTT